MKYKQTEKTIIDSSSADYAVLNQQINRLQEIKEEIEKLELEKDKITEGLFLLKQKNNYFTSVVIDEKQATFVEGNTFSASEELFNKLKTMYGLDSEYFKNIVNVTKVKNTEFANELTVTPKKAYITIKNLDKE